MRFLILLVFIVSCGSRSLPIKDKGSNQINNQTIKDKTELYLRLSNEKITQNLKWGWADNTGDAFLFICLYNVGGGDSDFTKALSDTGIPKRNPEISPKDSKTPWSKDMEIGLAWCLYNHPIKSQALNLLKKHMEYGSNNNWDMCSAALEYNISVGDRVSRCRITGGLRNTLYKLLKNLGGKCDILCQTEINNPLNQDFGTESTGFEQHLATIHRYLDAKLENGITNNQLESFKKAAEKEPNNALYQCVYHVFLDGDTTVAANLLLDDTKFPNTRLPSKAEYCTDYLYQRDEKTIRVLITDGNGCITYNKENNKEDTTECNLTPGSNNSRATYNKDWLPCGSEEDTKIPIDFLFASACILNN